MLRRLILPTLATATLALAACNHETSQARLDSLPEPAPKSATHQTLAFTDDGANAKLASTDSGFGGPGLMLECEHGGRLIHLARVSGGSEAATLMLSADGRGSKLPAQSQTFEGRRLLIADASPADPALAGFRRSAVLRVEDGDRTLTATAENGREGVERFFAACEARA